MIYEPVVVGLVVLVGLVVFFWRRSGPGSGRSFGNRVAAHIGLPRNVFHTLLDNGVAGSSRELLARLEKSRTNLDDASSQLGPVLGRGLERLEARFGAQEIYNKAKPIVARLVRNSEHDDATVGAKRSEA